MAKVVSKTKDALSRFGERLERRLSTGDDSDTSDLAKSGSNVQLPMYGYPGGNRRYASNQGGDIYGGVRNSSSGNLAGNGSGVFNGGFANYAQNQMMNPYGNGMGRAPYGTGIGGPMNNGYQGGYAGSPNMGQYGGAGDVGYAPDYYVAERRQVELVPAPPPRYIRQPVPVPYPVDRPVPQPYPVEVSRPVPVDRPYPVAVPTPVAVDRPVPVPYYVPVGVPVPSPPPSPVMFETSVTQTQRWTTGSPVMMNQQRYLAGSPVMMNQQRFLAGSPAMGANPYQRYGNGSFYC